MKPATAFRPTVPVRRHRLARTALACALPLAVAAAAAQQAPLSNASVDELIDKLSQPTQEVHARAFTPTAAPDASSNLCAGRPEAGGGGTQGRNFTVEAAVPYAGDGATNVNLDVRFATGSDALSPPDMAQLGRLATAMKSPKLATARFAIAGHTDAVGSNDLNLRLSCARALSSQRYLVAQGVRPERLSAYGFGPFKPLQAGALESSTNRRVEIRRAADR